MLRLTLIAAISLAAFGIFAATTQKAATSPANPREAARLNNLGAVLIAMGQAEKALTFYQQGVDMYRKLFPASKYPDGHPDLVASLHNLGFRLLAMNQAEKALDFFQQSLQLVLQAHLVAGQLLLSSCDRAPQPLFGIGHKT